VEREVRMEVESLLKRIESLQRENTRELEQIRREKAQLKRKPLFVASVVRVMEGGEAYLRQHGNNQEYITQVKEELHRALKPGTKVAVNDSLSIVKILEEP
jgi:proteasome regulatory subunit